MLDGITDSMDTNSSKFQKTVEDRGAWHGTVHGVAESDTTLRLNNKNMLGFVYTSRFFPKWFEKILTFPKLIEIEKLKLNLSDTHLARIGMMRCLGNLGTVER